MTANGAGPVPGTHWHTTKDDNRSHLAVAQRLLVFERVGRTRSAEKGRGQP
jgi:hypothetical protein